MLNILLDLNFWIDLHGLNEDPKWDNVNCPTRDTYTDQPYPTNSHRQVFPNLGSSLIRPRMPNYRYETVWSRSIQAKTRKQYFPKEGSHNLSSG